MQKLPYQFGLRVVVLCGIVLGCSSERVSQPAPTQLESIADETREQIVSAKDELFARLSRRLMQVIQEQGVAAAIKVCSEEAPDIAQSVSRERELKIGRTSLQLRNPKNEPPIWTKSILKRNSPVEPQFFDLGQGDIGAIFPIKMQTTCLLCHGPQERLLDDLKSELKRLYPSDMATGYREGDSRGWFWVNLPNGSGATNDRID